MKFKMFSLNLKKFVILTFLSFLSINNLMLKIDDVFVFNIFISFCKFLLRLTNLTLSILNLLTF